MAASAVPDETPGRRGAIDGDRAVVVVAGDDLRPGHDLDAGDGADRHHLAGAVAHIDVPDVGNVAAVGRLALNVDLPGAAVEIEVVDVDAAERRLQRGEDVADVEAERLRLGAVDVEIDRRIGRGEGREHARQPRVPIGRADQAARDAAHRRRVLPLQRLELVLEAAAGRESDDRRQVERQHVGLPDLRAPANVRRISRLRRIRRRLAVRERLQPRHHEGVVRLGGAVEQRKADDRERVLDRRHLLEQRFDLLGHLAGARHRRAIGQLHRDEERALILFGEEPGRRQQRHAENAAGEHQHQHERQRGHSHQPADDRRRSGRAPSRCRRARAP